MESLEQLNKQLSSLEELRTIVKTMKAVSAASIRQYEKTVNALDGYYQNVEHGLHIVLKDMRQTHEVHQTSLKAKALAAIVFGSNHGLALTQSTCIYHGS
jgi:F-type H+-transporting ATPase subunit gamma